MFDRRPRQAMLDELKLPRIVSRVPRNRLSRRLLRWRPPAAPTGWSVGPPDFVGVGAQRSGSSWWYRVAVESHPDVVRVAGRMKELHFFDRYWADDAPADLAARYHRFFPRPNGAITGEWTPRYMYDHWSLRLLSQAAPDARILVILRDPVERFRSGIAMTAQRGRNRGRTLDMLAAAVSRGAYADQLRRIFDFYPRDQVLVLQYERCTSDQLAQMARTWEFLGLDPGAAPREERREAIRSPSKKPELPTTLRDDLVARFRHDVAAVAELCPEVDVSLWRNFA